MSKSTAEIISKEMSVRGKKGGEALKAKDPGHFKRIADVRWGKIRELKKLTKNQNEKDK